MKQFAKVENLKGIKNQFIIKTNKGEYFQSYDSIIAFYDAIKNKIFLDVNKWNYSKTTAKYRNIFMGESTKDTQKNIDNGTYILIDLNKQYFGDLLTNITRANKGQQKQKKILTKNKIR